MSEFLGEFLQYLALMACMLAGWSLTRCASRCFGRERWPSHKKEMYDDIAEGLEENPESWNNDDSSTLTLPLKSKTRSCVQLSKQIGELCDSGEEGQASLGEPEPEAETATVPPAVTANSLASVSAKAMKAKAKKARKQAKKAALTQEIEVPRPQPQEEEEEEEAAVHSSPEVRSRPEPLALDGFETREEEEEEEEEEEKTEDEERKQQQEETKEEGEEAKQEEGPADRAKVEDTLSFDSLVPEEALQDETSCQERDAEEKHEEPEAVAAAAAAAAAAASPSGSSSPTRYSEKYSFIKGRLWSDVDDDEEDWVPPLPAVEPSKAEMNPQLPETSFVDFSSFTPVVTENGFQLYTQDNQSFFMLAGWDMSQQAGYFGDLEPSAQVFQTSMETGSGFFQPPVFHGMQDTYCEMQCQQEEEDNDEDWGVCWDFFPRARGAPSPLAR